MALEQITGEVVTDDQQEPSQKNKLAAMKKAKEDAIAEAEKKKKLVTPKRLLEVADSLENNAYSTMRAASNLQEKAKSDVEKKGANYLQGSGAND